MKKKTVPVITFILVLAICGCTAPKEKITLIETDMSYAEFVHSCPDCQEYETDEFILLSNNLLFRKSSMDRYAKDVNMFLAYLDDPEMQNLLNGLSGFAKTDALADINCPQCELYRIYYGDGQQTYRYSTEASNAPTAVLNYQMSLERAIQTSNPMDQLFIQFVYTLLEGPTHDYHFFPDGTVLYEAFGESEGELITAKLFRIAQQDLESVRGFIKEGFFSSDDSFEGCASSGLLHGYVSVYLDGRYALVWSCGESDSPASNTFNSFRRAFQR